MNSEELVNETSNCPMCSDGPRRSITNWWSGDAPCPAACSAATLVLFVLFRCRSRRRRPAVGSGHAQAFHHAVDIGQTRAEAQEQTPNHRPGPRSEAPVDQPSDAEAKDHGDNQLHP